MNENRDDKSRARRRALRAAQVATLGLALAGGCHLEHTAGPRAMVTDAERVARDGGTLAGDAGAVPGDAGAPGVDAAAATDLGQGFADAAAPCAVNESWGECCDRVEWACDEANSWGCCAWGPYLPPAEGALPASRPVLA